MNRIKINANLVDQAFRKFRSEQIHSDIEQSEIVNAKNELTKKLEKLKEELNRYLASEYDVDYNNGKKLDIWMQNYQPFHWFAEFYGVCSDGGFDIILGNPPYVEYKEVRSIYEIKDYFTEGCGNLYAFFIERSHSLLREHGRFGMIVPVASVCTDGYSQVQEILRKQKFCLMSFFNDRPGKLFQGLEHIRLAIILSERSVKPSNAILYTSKYHRWMTEFRPFIFELISFTNSTNFLAAGSFAKVGSEIEIEILNKIRKDKRNVTDFEASTNSNELEYTRKLSYFVQILDFIPKIVDSKGRNRPPSELKEIAFKSKDLKNAFLTAFNSSLFYWYLTVYSDCRNLNRRELEQFPFDPFSEENGLDSSLTCLAKTLMVDIKKNSRMIEMKYEKMGTLKIQCIFPRLSKSIIDDIDRRLAKHYHLTDEELDFILNYDIKFRLGTDSDELN